MNPYLFKIGDFGVKWYSALIIIAIIVVTTLITVESKKFKINKDFLINLMFWTIVFGIIGARLYFVIFNWDYYGGNRETLSEIYKIWEGGLAIHGGLIFGIITIIIYCKKYKVKPLLILDICAPYMFLAQAIGRWGNFFNGEAYGTATTLGHLKSLYIPNFIINGMYIDGVYYTPTFFYESLWCILGLIILLIIRKLKYTKIGYLTGGYLMWYSIGRFVIEKFRTDSLMLSNIKVAQLVSILLFVVGLVIVILQSTKPKLENLYNEKEKVEVVNF